MNEKFFDLNKEKQDRMINAALKVFALEGYLHGSTDDIVRDAGISKGLLFHYFGSKLGLYSFLYDYSVRFFMLEVDSEINRNESDFFELYSQFVHAQANSMRQYPYLQLFLHSAETETDQEATAAIMERKAVLHNMYAGIMKKGDISRFTEGADYEKIGHLLDYMLRGIISDKKTEKEVLPNYFLEETMRYISMMRKLTYKD
ncbi:MAG: TetR/AcrR family transcriptional regulator [Butyrivibrio sp.]|nr:TetR/AcrR family transcriptional regulator [Butyrivibrio sp.]